jgi:hypothetical protein
MKTMIAVTILATVGIAGVASVTVSNGRRATEATVSYGGAPPPLCPPFCGPPQQK